MAGRLDGDREVALAGGDDRSLDVSGARRLDDDRRARIERRVERAAQVVVSGLAGQVNGAVEGAPQECRWVGHLPV